MSKTSCALRVAAVGTLAVSLLGCGAGEAPSDTTGRGGSGAGGAAGTVIGGGGGGGHGGAAPSGGTGGVAGTGGAAPAVSVGTGGAGVAGSGAGGTGGGPVTGSGGGLATGAGEPRVLVVNARTPTFATYGRNGEIAHDYVADLDFGVGFAGRSLWVDARAINWDAGATGGVPRLTTAAPGLAEPSRGSRIVLGARNETTGKVKVKVLTVAGAVESAFTLDGYWNGFALSPARKYIYATTPGASSDSNLAALVRPSDGAILWQKNVTYAAFARDDAHLVYIPTDRSSPVQIRDLGTGDEVTPALTQEPLGSEPNIQIDLQAALTGRVVLLASGAMQSRLLYQMDWAGTITRFGSETPQYTDEYLQAFDPTGQRVLWSQQANGLDGKPRMPLGSYEMTLGSNQATAWNGPDTRCFGRPAERTFKLEGTALQSCNCGDNLCTTIATVPAPPSPTGWAKHVIPNADRRAVVVSYSWSGDSKPPASPDVLCYSASGQLLATVPSGYAELDPTGQLLLLHAEVGTANAGQTAIVDLASGQIHWLGRVSATIVVE